MQKRFQGHADIPLDEQGRAQAQALRRVLSDHVFDHAISSDLVRAYETAQIICGEQEILRDKRWREFAFGQWEGLTWTQIVQRWPHLSEYGSTAAKLYTPDGGESFMRVCERVAHALDDLREQTFENVLIVTHAGPLHAMLHVLFGERESDSKEALSVTFSPASVTRVDLGDERAVLLGVNEVGHLAVQ